MTAQELINKLQALEDKSIPVVISVPIYDHMSDVCGSELAHVEGANQSEGHLDGKKTAIFYVSEH